MYSIYILLFEAITCFKCRSDHLSSQINLSLDVVYFRGFSWLISEKAFSQKRVFIIYVSGRQLYMKLWLNHWLTFLMFLWAISGRVITWILFTVTANGCAHDLKSIYYLFQRSFKIRFIYINYVPVNQIPNIIRYIISHYCSFTFLVIHAQTF